MSSKSRWKLFVALATVLVVGTVAFWLTVGKMQEREELVGRVDPETGYRCRFTVSTSWQCNTEPQRLTPFEYRTFTFSPNPIQHWINIHFLHRSSLNPPAIHLIDGPLFGPFHTPHPSEYPLPYRTGFDEQIEAVRHLEMAGCPATMFTVKYGSVPTTKVIVAVPGQTVMYELEGKDEDINFSPVDREMQAIIASFYVEKVEGGKR